MGVKNPKTYTKDFKSEALALADQLGSVAKASLQLGLPATTLYAWRSQLKECGSESFPGRGKLRASDAAFDAVQRENRQLRRDLDILKKATAFFVSQDR